MRNLALCPTPGSWPSSSRLLRGGSPLSVQSAQLSTSVGKCHLSSLSLSVNSRTCECDRSPCPVMAHGLDWPSWERVRSSCCVSEGHRSAASAGSSCMTCHTHALGYKCSGLQSTAHMWNAWLTFLPGTLCRCSEAKLGPCSFCSPCTRWGISRTLWVACVPGSISNLHAMHAACSPGMLMQTAASGLAAAWHSPAPVHRHPPGAAGQAVLVCLFAMCLIERTLLVRPGRELSR